MHVRPDLVIRLENETCPYCRRDLLGLSSDVEHVIGRRFVPRGTLDRSWNLLLHACRACNGYKSDLENDISAITMQGDALGRLKRTSPELLSEARRKQRSISRRTRKPVGVSRENINIATTIAPNMTASFKVVSPPQIDLKRIFELASFQVAGLFYYLTYDEQTSRTRFWIDGFQPVFSSLWTNWGNAIDVAFMASVADWPTRLNVTAARGYFRASVRRHPDLNASCWSWALEWNASLRAIGFIGDPTRIERITATYPRLTPSFVGHSEGNPVFALQDVPLADDADSLFCLRPDEQVESESPK